MKFVSLWREEPVLKVKLIFSSTVPTTSPPKTRVLGDKVFGVKLPGNDVWSVMNINGNRWTFIKRSKMCEGPINGRHRFIRSDGALLKSGRHVGVDCMSIPDAVKTLKTVDHRIFFDPFAITRNGVGVSYLKLEVPNAASQLARDRKDTGEAFI